MQLVVPLEPVEQALTQQEGCWEFLCPQQQSQLERCLALGGQLLAMLQVVVAGQPGDCPFLPQEQKQELGEWQQLQELMAVQLAAAAVLLFVCPQEV